MGGKPRCRCSYAYGRWVAVGPQTGERSWELLRDLWRAVAPLMAPWCAKEDAPTSVNLGYYGGSGLCVRWRRDDEALFGGQESKLIISVNVGFSALFRWKPRSSLECDSDSCWLHHGDLQVMDGRCQDKYFHSTDPKLHGERVNITFRLIENHLPQCLVGARVVCCLPTCARGLAFPPARELRGRRGNLGEGGGRGSFWSCLGGGLLALAILMLVGLWKQEGVVLWLSLWCSIRNLHLPYCKMKALWDPC